MLLLAQSSDVSSVPSDFVKWFVVMSIALATLGLHLYNAYFRKQKREISGRVQHERVPEFADADEVEALRRSVETDKSAFTVRIATLQHSFAEGLHSLGKETLQGLGEIKSLASRHDATIAQIERRMTVLEDAHNEQIARLHSRVDDAMRNSSNRKN